MKNKLFASILTIGATLLSVFTLASCGAEPTDKPTSQIPGSESSSSSVSSEAKEFHQYVDDVHLQLDYKGKDFYKDGIGQVKLKNGIDGDTAHFYPVIKDTSKDIIKARFYGIDTPESTGKVQEWGKPASKFTTSKLENAAKNGTIVVSTPADGYQKPIPDSTGTRYVSLVWVNETVKDAPMESLKLLNLWIVQEGLSNVKNVQQIPQYSDIFYAAEQQAKDFKLNMFSGEKDPYFNYGEHKHVSLLDIKKELEECMKDPSRENAYDNELIIVQGTVAGYTNGILYLQNFYTEEEGGRYNYTIDGHTIKGEFAGINIFTGPSAIPSKYTTQNAYIQVAGLAQDGQFGFQVTDARFKTLPKKETDAQVILPPDANTDEHKLYVFDRTAEQVDKDIKAKNTEYLFSKVKIDGVLKCNDAYVTDNKDIILSFENVDFQVFISFIYKGNPDNPNEFWNTSEQFVGKSFKVSGVLSIHKNSFQICPSTSEELALVK